MTSGSLGRHAFVLSSTGACRAAGGVREPGPDGECRGRAARNCGHRGAGRRRHERWRRCRAHGPCPRALDTTQASAARGADRHARHARGPPRGNRQLRAAVDQRLRVGDMGDQLPVPHRIRQRLVVRQRRLRGAGPNLPIPLEQFANGAGAPPMQGDLMIFGPGWLGSYWDGSGHVAVVRDTGAGYVDVVEQNATSSGTDRFALNGSLVRANGYTPIIGWLRETEQAPVELTSSSVAGTPQSVSDQPGNIDVIWRGTDTRLHEIAYRSEAWQPQALAAISPAGVASDPAVISPAPGQVDAFWEDGSGDLWQIQSQTGFFGS